MEGKERGPSEWEQGLTDIERAELFQFLVVHHPPLWGEMKLLIRADQIDDVPILLGLLYADMKRFQAGTATRYATFINEPLG